MNLERSLMKKTLVTLAVLANLGVAAQNSAVVSAYMALQDNKLAEAAGYIEPTIASESTSGKEKTWRYRGDIYSRIAFSEDAALKTQFPDALDKAITSYIKANELDTKGSNKSDNDKALRNLQILALNSGNDAFTAKDYDKAIARYGLSETIAKSFGQADTNAVFNSALAYEGKGDLTNAAARYKESIAMGNNKPEIYRYLAGLQKKSGDLNAAIATVQEGRKVHPKDKELMLDEVAYLQEAGRSAEVEASVSAALQQDPGNCTLHSVMAGIYEGKANPKEGAAPPEADAMKWYDMAETEYKKAIDCDPKLFDAYFNIGVLYNNRAANEYEKCNAIKDDAAYTKCKKVADDIYLKAIPYFEKAHDLNADDKPTMEQLKKLYAKTGNSAKFDEMKKLLGE